MGLQIGTEMTLVELAEIFNLSSDDADVLTSAQCKLVLSPKNMVIADSAGLPLATVNVKMGVFLLAKNNSLGAATKSMIRDELEQAYDKAVGHIPVIVTGCVEPFKTPGGFSYVGIYDEGVKKQCIDLILDGANKTQVVKLHRELTGSSLVVALECVNEWWMEAIKQHGASLKKKTGKKKKKTTKKTKASVAGTAADSTVKDKEGVMSGTAVLLPNATELFQPIKGSDSGSVYFAIAVGPKVNVGCRVKSDGYVSIRVDGPEINSSDVVSHLNNSELSKCGGGHWSLHMTIPDKELIKKTVGAIMYSLALPFNKMASDITAIMGKGS